MYQYDRAHKIYQTEPSFERNLWSAVIMQASEDCRIDEPQTEYKTYLRRHAIAWLCSFSEEENSFKWICQQLDLPEKKVRTKALAGELGFGYGEFYSADEFTPERPRWKYDRAGYMRDYRAAIKAAAGVRA